MENINIEDACVMKEEDGNYCCASDDIENSIISVKEEAIEELELHIKEDLSDFQMIGDGCEINLVQTKLEPADDGTIEENPYFINPNGLGSHVKAEECISSENPSTTECVTKATSSKDFFATCNHCLKAFYRGFTYDQILKQRTGKTNWKCSERNRGCCAEVRVFIYSKYFMELEGHTCRTEEGDSPPLVLDKVSLTEQRCTSPPPRTFYIHDELTRYVPLKKVISFLDRETIADIEPAEPTTIVYNIIGSKNTVAVYMGSEYKVKKGTDVWLLNCAHVSCPGLLRLLTPNKAIAKIKDHTCDTNTDSIDVNVPLLGISKVFHYKDQVFGDSPPDIPDDALAYYCKFVSGHRTHFVLYRRHHYLYSIWNNPYYIWKCEYSSCRTTLKITKNNKVVLLVGDHSCGKLLEYEIGARPCEEQHWNKKINKSFIGLEADGKQYVYNLGYLYKSKSAKDHLWLCIHQEAFGCHARLKFDPDQYGFLMSASGHNCFLNSRSVNNLMVFQRHSILGEYAYFRGYVYKRFRMLNESQQVYNKWVCPIAGCKGVLTTKLNEVVAESAHVCQMDGERPVEAECIVLSNVSDKGRAHKKIKTE